MSNNVGVITVLTVLLALLRVLFPLMGAKVESCLKVCYYLCDCLTGNDIETCDQGGLHRHKRGEQPYDASLAYGPVLHGQYSIELDERAGGADSSNEGNILPCLNPRLTCPDSISRPISMGQIKVGSSFA